MLHWGRSGRWDDSSWTTRSTLAHRQPWWRAGPIVDESVDQAIADGERLGDLLCAMKRADMPGTPIYACD